MPYSTEADLMEILQSFKIHVRVVGEDYKNIDFTGRSFCEEHEIKIYYNSRKHLYSSTNLKKRLADIEIK